MGITGSKAKLEKAELLVKAAEGGEMRTVRLLVDQVGSSLVNIGFEGDYAIAAASRSSHPAIVKFLIEKVQDGPTSLVRLLLEKSKPCFHAFLEADVNRTNFMGQNALIVAASKKTLKDNNIDFIGSGQGKAGLKLRSESPTAVIKLLLSANANVHHANYDGYTALHLASYHGHHQVVLALLNSGAKINVRADAGQTPLILAATQKHTAVVEILLDHGADVNIRDEHGQTAFMMAVKIDGIYIAKKIIETGKMDYTITDARYGRNALSWCIDKGRLDLIELLLDKGAKIQASKNFRSESLIQQAARLGHFDIVNLLALHGADLNEKINGVTIKQYVVEKSGQTPTPTTKKDPKPLVKPQIEKGPVEEVKVEIFQNNSDYDPVEIGAERGLPLGSPNPLRFTQSATSSIMYDEEKKFAGDHPKLTDWKGRDVVQWLESIEMGMYAQSFVDGGIDGDMLLVLEQNETESQQKDFKSLLETELGVIKKLHRIKLCKHIRILRKKEDELLRKSSTLSFQASLFPSKTQLPPDSISQFSNKSVESVVPIGLQNKLPDEPKQFDFSELALENEIGAGAFGTVFSGMWRGTRVAVKILHRKDLDKTQIEDFIQEARMMQFLGTHPSIVSFCGFCLNPPCIVTNFFENGSIRDILWKEHKDEVPPEKSMLTLPKLIDIALQAAAGIFHLHKEGVIHRDIAARNVLCDKHLNTVITDFGMSRLKRQEVQHTQSSVGPVKWMAPECIQSRVYSEKTDSYAFGIYLWESFSRQSPPYPELFNIEAAFKVVNENLRPVPSKDTPDIVKDLMCRCWDRSPDKRPGFEEIVDILSKLKKKHCE